MQKYSIYNMLTNDDLLAIKGIVKDVVKDEVDPLKKELKAHGEMLKSHGEILKFHSEILNSHGKILKSHEKILRSLKKDQDTMLNMLDQEQMEQRKKIKGIEEHLGMPLIS